MNGNYRALEEILKGYWLQPNRAERFYFDFEDEIDVKTAEADGFEVVYIAIQETERAGDTVQFILDVYSLDIRTEGGENSLDVVSDTHQKLTDFQSALENELIEGVYLESFGRIVAVENGMFDGLDGNKLTGLVIDMDIVDYCEAP